MLSKDPAGRPEPPSTEKTRRIVMFCDLRDSTDILLNFELGIYHRRNEEGRWEEPFTYEEFILDVHETSYKELYLGHENTLTEIYGDGVMAVFPEDNAKYLLENIYRLTGRMRKYNDSDGIGLYQPRINIGFGITVGEISLARYSLDGRYHPAGRCVHEASRIESVSRLYDARVLVSDKFLRYAEGYIQSDPRFSCRFIDRVVLKNFREPVALFELLFDNDPRFDIKKMSVPVYSEAYAHYCRRQWEAAGGLFRHVYDDYGLGVGLVMAKRCESLLRTPPGANWNGIWKMKDK